MTQQRVSPISVTSVLPAVPVLSLQAALGQSADLTQWRNSSGTVLSRVDSAGRALISRVQGIQFLNTDDNGGRARIYSDTSNHLYIATGGGGTPFLTLLDTGNLTSTTSGAATVNLIVKGFASQTADLQQWQNSAGTVLARIASNGDFLSTVTIGAPYFSDGTATRPYIDFTVANKMIAQARNAAYVAWTVRGAASQTANLQEWQNSSGTVQASIAANGDLTNNGIYTVYGRFGAATFTDAAALRVNGYSTSVPTAVIRAIASQTANLQEWQNSAGTVLARITSGGVIQGPTQTINAYVRLQEESSGGSIQITKLTAQAGSPGTSNGVLYFRDGTNAGTLKLVVRAGSAGAETTILDNIPQT